MTKKFTKVQLAAAIAAANVNLTDAQALSVLNTMDDIIAKELVSRNVYLDNIGTFKRVVKKATRKNVITGKGTHEVRDIPEHVVVKLIASQTLVDRVK